MSGGATPIADDPAAWGAALAHAARQQAQHRLREWCAREAAVLADSPLWLHRWDQLADMARASEDAACQAIVLQAGLQRWQGEIDSCQRLLSGRRTQARLRRKLGVRRSAPASTVQARRSELIDTREAWRVRLEDTASVPVEGAARSIGGERTALDELTCHPLAELLAAGDLAGAHLLAHSALARFPHEQGRMPSPPRLASAVRLVRAYRALGEVAPPIPLLSSLADIDVRLLREHSGDRDAHARNTHGWRGAETPWQEFAPTRDMTELVQRVWACAEGRLGRVWHQTFILPFAPELIPEHWEQILVREGSHARLGYRLGFQRDSVRFDIIGVRMSEPIAVAEWEWRRTDRLAQRLGADTLGVHEVYVDGGAAAVFGIVPQGRQVELTTHYPRPAPCLHPHATWACNDTADTLVRACPSCLRSRLGAIPLHQLPEGHEALRDLDDAAYCAREQFYRHLAGEREGVENWAQLRACHQRVRPHTPDDTPPSRARPATLAETFFRRPRA